MRDLQAVRWHHGSGVGVGDLCTSPGIRRLDGTHPPLVHDFTTKFFPSPAQPKPKGRNAPSRGRYWIGGGFPNLTDNPWWFPLLDAPL